VAARLDVDGRRQLQGRLRHGALAHTFTLTPCPDIIKESTRTPLPLGAAVVFDVSPFLKLPTRKAGYVARYYEGALDHTLITREDSVGVMAQNRRPLISIKSIT
jgi:hypothetical protein